MFDRVALLWTEQDKLFPQPTAEMEGTVAVIVIAAV